MFLSDCAFCIEEMKHVFFLELCGFRAGTAVRRPSKAGIVAGAHQTLRAFLNWI